MPEEIKNLGQIIENITVSPQNQVKDDIEELKKDVTEYKEDLKQVEQIAQSENLTTLKETKSAKILSKRVDKLIKDLDKLVLKIQTVDTIDKSQADKTMIKHKYAWSKEASPEPDQHPFVIVLLLSKNMVSINEIIGAIRQLQGVSSDAKEKQIAQVLESLDTDKDGNIDDLGDVVKVGWSFGIFL